jgi:hypothetical protein
MVVATCKGISGRTERYGGGNAKYGRRGIAQEPSAIDLAGDVLA